MGLRRAAPAAVLGPLLAPLLAAACSEAPPASGQLVVSPAAVDFGRVRVGTAGKKQVKLENRGTQTLTITATELPEALAGELRIEGVPARMPPGVEPRTVDLVFLPRERGARAGTIALLTDALVDPVAKIEIAGTAVGAGLAVSPEVVDFGRVLVGRAATSTVVIENVGDVPIELQAITPEPRSSSEIAASLPVIEEIAPGDTLPLTVRYRPANFGADEARFVIKDDSMAPLPVSFVARGEGAVSDLEVMPQSLRFAGVTLGEHRTQAIAIQNAGSETERIERVELTGAEWFSIEGVVSAFDLPPSGEARVEVRFEPREAGASNAELRVYAARHAAPFVVSIEGEAFAPRAPKLALSAERIDSGAVEVGGSSRRELAVINLGRAELRIASISVRPAGAPFSVAFRGAPPPWRLAAGDRRALKIHFAPSSPAPSVSAELVIASDDPDRPEIAVALAGSARDFPVANLAVSSEPVLDVGRLPVGTRAARVITVENQGTAPLEIRSAGLVAPAGAFDADVFATLLGPPIAPGQTRASRVLFRSSRAGVSEGTFRIESDDPARGSIDLGLRATAVVLPAAVLEADVSLTWSGVANVDLHVLAPGGGFLDAPTDCCWCNPTPDWGRTGSSADDPVLESDQIRGGLEERITLRVLPAGSTSIVVHHRGGEPVVARVDLTLGGARSGSFERAISQGQRWDVARLVRRDRMSPTSLVVDGDPLVPVAPELDGCD